MNLKTERSDYTGDVADLCFADCAVFAAVEHEEANPLNHNDPIESAVYRKLRLG
jgi:hypothetical protein